MKNMAWIALNIYEECLPFVSMIRIEGKSFSQEIDLEFLEWLTGLRRPYVLVFTKIDRGTPEEVMANINAFKERIAGWFTQLPEIFQCSSATAQGRSELLGVISGPLDAEASPVASLALAISADRGTAEAVVRCAWM